MRLYSSRGRRHVTSAKEPCSYTRRAELKSEVAGDILQVGKQMHKHRCCLGGQELWSPHFSFHPSWWAGQEQALPLCLLENNESAFAAGTMSSTSTKVKKNILFECFEIVSGVGVKDASFVLSACNNVGLHSRWAKRFTQRCLTFPNGGCLEFPIPWKKKLIFLSQLRRKIHCKILEFLKGNPQLKSCPNKARNG